MPAISSLSGRFLLALIAALALALGVSAAAQAATVGDFTTIAHRGYHARTTENSLAALDSTVKAGATAMETDVRLTRGGAMVIMHDARFARTSHCWGYIHRATLRKVRSYRCRLNNGQRIPTMVGVLDRARGKALNVVIEIKRDPLNRWTFSRMSTLKNVIAAHGMARRVRIISFEPSYTRLAKRVGMATALIGGNRPYSPDEVVGVADAVLLYSQYVTPEVVAEFDAAGVTVAGRESNDPAVWQALLDHGAARSIVSDAAPALVAWMAAYQPAQ